MRILQIIPVFAPAWQAGGPVNVVYNISRELASRGHEVYVYTTNFLDTTRNFMPTKDEYILDGIHIVYFKNYLRRGAVLVSPGMACRFLSKSHRFDIVHLHSYRGFQDFLVSLFLKGYIVQPHGSLTRVYKSARKLLYDSLFGGRLLRGAAGIIALNHLEAEHCKAMGIPEEKIWIISNGIRLSDYKDLPEKGSFRGKFSISSDKAIILYLGRIHRIKGLSVLVEAFAKLLKQSTNVKLVIVGPDDGYMNELRTLCNASDLRDNVLFSNPLHGREKLEAYVDADVVVIPSFYETFPLTVLEAYMCAKPVVASDVGGLSEIVVHGSTGLLFRPSDSDELAYCLTSLVDNLHLASEMGLRGKSFVESNFDMKKVVDKLEKMYQENLLR
jgi:glycosyltransferase involved in cell wall biosynthesis